MRKVTLYGLAGLACAASYVGITLWLIPCKQNIENQGISESSLTEADAGLEVVCGNALSDDKGRSCFLEEVLPETLDFTTSSWESFGSGSPEAVHFCRGGKLYFLSNRGHAGALICNYQEEEWKYLPQSLHFEGLATRFKKDALGRPVYIATQITPLDQNGQPNK